MNILLVNHYAGSPAHGMEFRPHSFAREWSSAGHRVTIVAASYTHLRQANPKVTGLCREELIDGIRYVWLRTPGYKGNGIGRVFNIGFFLLQLIVHLGLLRNAARDGAVIASSTYPFDAIVGKWIANFASASLTYEVHDLWPLSPIELGGMSPYHPFIRAVQWSEDFAYRNADHVVSMLPLAEPYMRRHGLAAGKFYYVPNGVDLAEWNEPSVLPETHRKTIEELRVARRFLIGYAGSHGVANGLDSIVQAAQMLADSSATFVFVGQGPEKGNLQALSARLNVANVVFLAPVPKAAIQSFLAEMDSLIITLQRSSLFRFGISPNKLMDYMRAERPIIQAIDAGNDIVAESGCGFTVSPEDPNAIASAALRMMSLPSGQRDEMGRRGRQYVERNHDCQKLAARFAGILCEWQHGARKHSDDSRLASV